VSAFQAGTNGAGALVCCWAARAHGQLFYGAGADDCETTAPLFTVEPLGGEARQIYASKLAAGLTCAMQKPSATEGWPRAPGEGDAQCGQVLRGEIDAAASGAAIIAPYD
jgi:hypothetical protein